MADPTLSSLDQNAYLLFRAEKGLKAMGLFDKPEYRERLLYEWKTICTMNFAGYFLVVSDYVCWAKAQNIPVGPGRGSGGGSLVAYAIGIIDVDPIQRGLYWERFLNPGRSSMPDFDIDFSPRGVSRVIDYIVQTYGAGYTARIGTTGTMKSRLAVRDVARTLGCSTEEIDAFGKLIPEMARGGVGDSLVTLELCLNPTKEFLSVYQAEYNLFFQHYQRNSRFQEVVNIAARLEGLPKSSGISAAGVLISPVPLAKTVPLRLPKTAESQDDFGEELGDIPIVDWSLKAVEELGLVKFDFLVLDSLDVIDDAEKMIERDLGVKIDWRNIPEDDKETFEMLSNGDTYGVFQLTEVWLADFCRQFRPQSVQDISTISALYRPGPKDNGMVDAILEVRRTGVPNRSPIPVVNEILKSTNSVLTYQEQILEIAVKVAGYTLSQADLLRRAMGKKDAALMLAEKQRFVDGAKRLSNVSEKDATELFDVVEKFSSYCFNLSHSIAYSIISYRMAYLKCHYPVYFHTADLTAKAHKSFEKLLPSLNDARKHGLKILPPSINEADVSFSVLDRNSIVFGFGGVKNLGSNTVEMILGARHAGPFKDLYDFSVRIDASKVNSGHIKQLAFAGAFDLIEPDMNRAEIFQYAELLREAMKKERDRNRKFSTAGQLALFDIEDVAPVSVIKPILDFPQEEKLKLERETMGLYLSGSPLDAFAFLRERYLLDNIGDLSEMSTKGALLGVVTARRDFMTKKGPACELVLEDFTGEICVMVWSDKLAEHQDLFTVGEVLLVRGRVSASRGLSLSLQEVASAKLEADRRVVDVKVGSLPIEILRKIARLPVGNTPLDLEIRGCFRYRLGFFDVTFHQLKDIHDFYRNR